MREVWITGVGAVSAAGIGTAPLRALLLEGRSAVCRGGLGWGTPAPLDVPGRAARRMDRSALLFMETARQAWEQSGMSVGTGADLRRVGVIEGSSLGAMADLVDEARRPEDGGRRARRLIRFMPGAGGATFAQAHGLGGPAFHLSAGSVSAAVAIGEAFMMIATGRLDGAVAGGGEAPLHPDVAATFRGAGILSDNPEWPCRPFDVHRDGTVLGEAAGAVVMEAADVARRRGAEPLAVLRGYATSTESGSMLQPSEDGAGLAAAVREVLAMVRPTRIAWIKAHGTGTLANDVAECRGLFAVLGNRLSITPLTSLKSTLGHALGASGAVELVATIEAARAGIVPACVGTSELDPALPTCTIATVPLEAGPGEVLLLSASFGGRSAALVIRSPALLPGCQRSCRSLPPSRRSRTPSAAAEQPSCKPRPAPARPPSFPSSSSRSPGSAASGS